MIALVNFNESDSRTTLDRLRGKGRTEVSRPAWSDRVRLSGMAGSILLAVGVWLPSFETEPLGSRSLIALEMADGLGVVSIGLLVLSLLSFTLALTRLHVGLWFTSFAAFLALALSGAGAIAPAGTSFSLGFGYWTMFIGIVLLFGAAFGDVIRDVRRPPAAPILTPPLRGSFTWCGRG